MPYELTPLHALLLLLLGGGVGALGAMVGVGGGFVLVPILIVLFPEDSTATLASMSLTVVFLNATSATITNGWARRVDWKTAFLLVCGALPAAVLGSLVSGSVSRQHFQAAFGVMLIFGAGYILWRRSRADPTLDTRHDPNREVRERRGPIYRFYVNGLLAGVISPAAGFISSFFGIGGGVIHMPALVYLLKIPPKVATATSLFILVPTSLAGILTHVFAGQFNEGWRRALLLGAGALVGGPAGVVLGRRVSQRAILTLLSLGLVAVGARQIVAGLGP